jgi:hypothetical protein
MQINKSHGIAANGPAIDTLEGLLGVATRVRARSRIAASI